MPNDDDNDDNDNDEVSQDFQTEPTTTIFCPCLPGRSKLLEDEEDEVIKTGMLGCSKTLHAVSHFGKVLARENDELLVMQRAIEAKAEDIEHGSQTGVDFPEASQSVITDSTVFSSSGFVTLRSRQAASDASQVLLSNDPASIEVTQASDPRGVVWENSTINVRSLRRRQYFVSLLVKVMPQKYSFILMLNRSDILTSVSSFPIQRRLILIGST
jgi:hypothetical protein